MYLFIYWLPNRVFLAAGVLHEVVALAVVAVADAGDVALRFRQRHLHHAVVHDHLQRCMGGEHKINRLDHAREGAHSQVHRTDGRKTEVTGVQDCTGER